LRRVKKKRGHLKEAYDGIIPIGSDHTRENPAEQGCNDHVGILLKGGNLIRVNIRNRSISNLMFGNKMMSQERIKESIVPVERILVSRTEGIKRKNCLKLRTNRPQIKF